MVGVGGKDNKAPPPGPPHPCPQSPPPLVVMLSCHPSRPADLKLARSNGTRRQKELFVSLLSSIIAQSCLEVVVGWGLMGWGLSCAIV